MRAQLVEHYLRPIGSRHGIYLIMWCNATEQWSEDDRRRKGVHRLDRGRLLEELEVQAGHLAVDGYTIALVMLDATWPPVRHA